ncbi:MAG: hypothetical protein CYPHOPRED_003097 [Cyphobasidiales sp. Tagirdzhanova-0007]|nr:MAG: hypothetical protein CYPHOPRED_003097 [Cyphobasidiales sp. Tagirdzhanova-0007]
MSDADLDAIRQRRLAQLTQGSETAGTNGVEEAEAAARQAAEEDENRRAVMSQILDPLARERLARIALVRPERERSLQELLVRMARSGQLRGRVTDDQLLSLLDQVAAAEGANSGTLAKSKITVRLSVAKVAVSLSPIQISRRRDKTASDDENDDDMQPKPSSRTKRAVPNDEDDDIFDL